jgi:hypothetical protein
VRNGLTGHIGVDPSLINAVVKQYGGSGEPPVEKVDFLDQPLAIIDVCNDIENQSLTLLDGGGGDDDDHDRETKRGG